MEASYLVGGFTLYIAVDTVPAPAPVGSAGDLGSSFIRAGRRRVTWPSMAAEPPRSAVKKMDTLLDEQIVEQLDFANLLPCEGVHHNRGLSGHDPAESGGFLVISPCCGPKVIQCCSRVDAMRVSGVLYCGACQHEHLTSEYQFVPLQL